MTEYDLGGDRQAASLRALAHCSNTSVDSAARDFCHELAILVCFCLRLGGAGEG